MDEWVIGMDGLDGYVSFPRILVGCLLRSWGEGKRRHDLWCGMVRCVMYVGICRYMYGYVVGLSCSVLSFGHFGLWILQT